jgi:chromate transport protein ChrA
MLFEPDNFADDPYQAGLNQMGHMVFGGACVIVFGVYVAALFIAAIELWQYYKRSAIRADTVTDTAFWVYGMLFYASWWFLPSVVFLGGAWMGAVWYMSK